MNRAFRGPRGRRIAGSVEHTAPARPRRVALVRGTEELTVIVAFGSGAVRVGSI